MIPSRRTLVFKIAPTVDATEGALAISSSAWADDTEIDEQGIYDGIEHIESIPDEVLHSQDGFEAWKDSHPVITPRGPIASGLALATAIFSNGFVVSRVLKIKAKIKAAGGAKKMWRNKPRKLAGRTHSAQYSKFSLFLLLPQNVSE